MYMINETVVSRVEFFTALKAHCKVCNYSYLKAIDKINRENKIYIKNICFRIRDNF